MNSARGRERGLRLAIAGLCVLAFSSGALLALGSPVRARPPDRPAQQPARTCTVPCLHTGSSHARPELLLAGEATTVTIESKMICGAMFRPFHVAFVVVQSEDIDEPTLQDIENGLSILITSLDLSDVPSTRVSLIEAKEDVRTLVPWTDERDRIERGIGRLSTGGSGSLDAAIGTATRALRQLRRTYCPQPAPLQLVVLIAVEPEGRGCSRARRSAQSAMREDVQIATACIGRNCDSGMQCLVSLSSLHRFGFRLPAGPGRTLIDVMEERVLIRDLSAENIEIIERLAPDVDYVADSAMPPAHWDPFKRTLRWRLTGFPTDRVTVSWQARPRRPGPQSPSLGAKLRWHFDGLDPMTRVVEPTLVQVFGPPETVAE